MSTPLASALRTRTRGLLSIKVLGLRTLRAFIEHSRSGDVKERLLVVLGLGVVMAGQVRGGVGGLLSGEQWAGDNEALCVIQDRLLKKARIKGTGRTAVTVWRTMVPSNMKAQTIQALQTVPCNAPAMPMMATTHPGRRRSPMPPMPPMPQSRKAAAAM